LIIVLYINRLIILEVAILAKIWPILQSRDNILDILVYIKQIRSKYLYKGLFLLILYILSQLAIGKVFNKMYKLAPNIY